MAPRKENTCPTDADGNKKRKAKEPTSTNPADGKKKREGLRQAPIRRVLTDVAPSSDIDFRSTRHGVPSDLRGVKASQGPVFEIQGQGTRRRYPEELKKAIAEMAIKRGNKETAEHFSRELGSFICVDRVSVIKKAHLGIRNKKVKGEDEEDREGEEEPILGGGEHVLQGNTGEVATSNQEEGVIIDARKEGQGEGGKRDVDEEGNVQQVKVPRVERDDDLSVEFDLRAGIKQTEESAKMKKIIAMEEQLQLKKQRKMLLEREIEELEQRLKAEKIGLKEII